ncbi:unnamed protein product [Camellia sinensis]
MKKLGGKGLHFLFDFIKKVDNLAFYYGGKMSTESLVSYKTLARLQDPHNLNPPHSSLRSPSLLFSPINWCPKMADVFEEEAKAEPTVSIHEYLKDGEDQELLEYIRGQPLHKSSLPTLDVALSELKAEEIRMREADLVLGGDEGKECTYTKGYMKRQAIFSCLTCTPDGNARVCTACSLSCHDGHETLWNCRPRVACGNSKFGEFFCKLFPNKDIENVENSYNHNFKGSYCTCGRPYPDPEAEEQVEMIQCCICEDWFHEEHIGLESSDECDFILGFFQLGCSDLKEFKTP